MNTYCAHINQIYVFLFKLVLIIMLRNIKIHQAQDIWHSMTAMAISSMSGIQGMVSTNVFHFSCVSRWRNIMVMASQITGYSMFIPHLIQDNDEECIKVAHYWRFLRGDPSQRTSEAANVSMPGLHIGNTVSKWKRADSRFAPSHLETVLLCNDVSRWLGASLKSAL